MTTIVDLAELPTLVGTDLGYTAYRTVEQEQINTFAVAADDDQWIHTDPERAASGPFGGPIAHGFLTLSLTIPFWGELVDVTGVKTKVNYGLEKVRFPAPTRAGARIRMTAEVVDVTEVPGGYQLTVDQSIETEGGTKPVVVARGLYRFYA
ncbi:MAG TPA: MaoC family dehydratase [Microbacterium sp.]|nr:MaoC family dehydratase [Microbacterium sp.]